MLKGSLLLVGTLAAGGVGLAGVRLRSSVAFGIAAGLVLALIQPLGLGATIVVAWLPPFAMVMAARSLGLTGRAGLVGFGVVLVGLLAYSLVLTLLAVLRAPAAWQGISLVFVLLPFGLVAWLALTRRSPPTARRPATGG